MAYDPGFQQASDRTFEKLGIPLDRPTPRFPRGDVTSRRQGSAMWLTATLGLEPDKHDNIERKEHKVLGHNQEELTLYEYRKKNAQKSLLEPAVLYIHGGGMILGSCELFEPVSKADVATTGVRHFSMYLLPLVLVHVLSLILLLSEYRLAPEFRHPTPVEDCYGALVWLSSNAEELGINPARIAVAGLSAGGGLAAGVALLARDRKLYPPIAKQILLSPMLDDRNTVTDEHLLPCITWSWDDNWTGWNALLGDEPGGSSVSQYAAPVRAVDLQGLPATYIEVGSVDIFADEGRAFADRLGAAGVDVEWHLYEGVPHGFEFRGAGSSILKQALSNKYAAIRSL